MTPDPFTQGERLLWAVLEGSEAFTSLVREGNRIKFGTSDALEEPRLDSTHVTDYPRVAIYPGSGQSNKVRTSAGPSLSQVYIIEISSGSMRTHAKMNPVKWAVWRAIEALLDQTKARMAFTYQVNTGSFQDSVNLGNQDERGPRGWVSVLDVTVEMKFPKSEMAP